jgi:hypothetical protein
LLLGPTTSATSSSISSLKTPRPTPTTGQQSLLRGPDQLAERRLHPLGQRVAAGLGGDDDLDRL